MRIVAGIARGRKLQAPRGSDTRPTTDRVREAMFSTLTTALRSTLATHAENPWELVDVLDLFAGSGALGLEALSRGARSAVFIERDRAALATLRHNIATLDLPGARVIAQDVHRVVGNPGASGTSNPGSLVFVDPPYDLPTVTLRELLHSVATGPLCAANAWFVVERNARQNESPWPDLRGAGREFLEHDRRTYGETALWYGHLDTVRGDLSDG